MDSLTASLAVTSLGWTTNHVTGDYLGVDLEQHDYTIFDKIEWVGPGGSLWSDYEVVQWEVGDPFAELGQVFRSRPARPALVSQVTST